MRHDHRFRQGETKGLDALRALDNVVLLPHLGSATAETRAAMGHMVLDNLDAFFGGTALPSRVV